MYALREREKEREREKYTGFTFGLVILFIAHRVVSDIFMISDTKS